MCTQLNSLDNLGVKNNAATYLFHYFSIIHEMMFNIQHHFTAWLLTRRAWLSLYRYGLPMGLARLWGPWRPRMILLILGPRSLGRLDLRLMMLHNTNGPLLLTRMHRSHNLHLLVSRLPTLWVTWPYYPRSYLALNSMLRLLAWMIIGWSQNHHPLTGLLTLCTLWHHLPTRIHIVHSGSGLV